MKEIKNEYNVLLKTKTCRSINVEQYTQADLAPIHIQVYLTLYDIISQLPDNHLVKNLLLLDNITGHLLLDTQFIKKNGHYVITFSTLHKINGNRNVIALDKISMDDIINLSEEQLYQYMRNTINKIIQPIIEV